MRIPVIVESSCHVGDDRPRRQHIEIVLHEVFPQTEVSIADVAPADNRIVPVGDDYLVVHAAVQQTKPKKELDDATDVGT